MTMIAQISAEMKEVLTEVAEVAAKESDFIQRQVKVSGSNLCPTLVFGWWQNPEATLEELSQLGKTFGLEITPQGLDQRWSAEMADFLQKVVGHVVRVGVEGQEVSLASMEAFSQVLVEDSSTVTMPETLSEVWQGNGGNGASSIVKMQVQLDIKNGALDGPHLVDGKMHDRRASGQHELAKPGSLQLRDLGYWQVGEWAEAVKNERYLLSRMKASTQFWHEDKAWNCYQWCAQSSTDQFETDILLGKTAKVPVRLLGFRVPADVAAERRRKLKRAVKKRGDTVSKERLALCDWTLIVTNSPAEIMSAEEALIWLRVRWQIELLFKLWKSIGRLSHSRSKKPWRILCEFYAKLIAMTLQQWVFAASIWQFPDRSWTKAAGTLRMHVIRIAVVLHDLPALRYTLDDICRILSTGCRINPSRKKPRTFQLLLAIGDEA